MLILWLLFRPFVRLFLCSQNVLCRMLIVVGFCLPVLRHCILLHRLELLGLVQFFLFVLNTIISLFSALAAATMHISPNSVSYSLSLLMWSQSACVVCAGINGSFLFCASICAFSKLLFLSCLWFSLVFLLMHGLYSMLYIRASHRQLPSALFKWPGLTFSHV